MFRHRPSTRTLDAAIDAAIAAGPPCVCTHERSAHVKPGWFDGPCTVDGCACTPAGYQFADGSPYIAPDMVRVPDR